MTVKRDFFNAGKMC